MKKLNLKEAFQTILKKDQPPRSLPKPLTSLQKKYPNWNLNKNEIVNFYYKPSEKKPNFDDIKSLPIKLKLTKIRVQSGLKEVM